MATSRRLSSSLVSPAYFLHIAFHSSSLYAHKLAALSQHAAQQACWLHVYHRAIALLRRSLSSEPRFVLMQSLTRPGIIEPKQLA